MKLELRGIEPKLKAYLQDKIENSGPLSEKELWKHTLDYFSPKMKISAENLAKSYKMMYGRKIGKKTAEMNILNNLRLMLSSIKKVLMHTERQVILGKDRHGRLFYGKGQEGRLPGKVIW